MTFFDFIWPHAVMLASAFGSATLLPGSSEIVFAAQIKAGVAGPHALLASATIGNVAGSAVNWWLGYHVRRFENRRWFPFKAAEIEAASARFKRFGTWSLLLSWLPVMGDPLTFVAGILRVPFGIFLLLVGVGKMLRYVALLTVLAV